MTAIHVLAPRAMGESTASILQHFYVIAAVAIVSAFIILRIVILRRRNQALSNFFRMGGNSQYSYGSYPPHDSGYSSMFHGIQLAPVPAAYRPDRRVRAADVDVQGRRLDSGGGDLQGKEELPAYDNLDRPPKYVEAGWLQGGPPPTGRSAMIPPTAGEQSGAVHANTTSGVPGHDVGQPDIHTAAGIVQGNDAPPLPPSYNGLPTS